MYFHERQLDNHKENNRLNIFIWQIHIIIDGIQKPKRFQWQWKDEDIQWFTEVKLGSKVVFLLWRFYSRAHI